MNTCGIKVGRLLEIRALSGYRTAAEVDEFFGRIALELAKLPVSRLVVVATDWRRCPLMSSDAAERALLKIVSNNPRTERSAALVSRDSPVAVLQFLRLVRESAHPNRKLFFEADKLIAWLSEVLNAEEIRRLEQFLD